MGQRHQLFVIAKVNGRYHNLCAIHHQWLRGDAALVRCLWTLNIFADPANRVPIEQELIAAQRHDEHFWTATYDEHLDKNSHVPFPFIATCLITGASFGPNDGYYDPVIVYEFSMEYNEGDNNDGKKPGLKSVFVKHSHPIFRLHQRKIVLHSVCIVLLRKIAS